MPDKNEFTINNSAEGQMQNINQIKIIKPRIIDSPKTTNNNQNNCNKSLFANKRYSCIGKCGDSIKQLVQTSGGTYVPTKKWSGNENPSLNAIIIGNTIQWTEKNLKKAIGKNIPLVHSSYITMCIDAGIVLPHGPYLAIPPHLVPQSSHSNSHRSPNKLRQKSKKLKNKINNTTVNDNGINGSTSPSTSDIQEIYSILCKDDHNNNNNNNQSDESPAFFDCSKLSFPTSGTSDGNMTRKKFVDQLNKIGNTKDKEDNIRSKNNKKRTIQPSYERPTKFNRKDELYIHDKTSIVICPGIFNMKCDNLIDFKSDIECCNSCMNKLLTNINKT